jgi:hypothetical protein
VRLPGREWGRPWHGNLFLPTQDPRQTRARGRLAVNMLMPFYSGPAGSQNSFSTLR